MSKFDDLGIVGVAILIWGAAISYVGATPAGVTLMIIGLVTAIAAALLKGITE